MVNSIQLLLFVAIRQKAEPNKAYLKVTWSKVLNFR